VMFPASASRREALTDCEDPKWIQMMDSDCLL